MLALQIVDRFTTIAGTDPLSALMLAAGALLMAVTFLFFGYLALGAVANLFGGDSVANVHGRRGSP